MSRRPPGALREAVVRRCVRRNGVPKSVFATEVEALAAAPIGDLFMYAYPCARHEGWHIGHNRVTR